MPPSGKHYTPSRCSDPDCQSKPDRRYPIQLIPTAIKYGASTGRKTMGCRRPIPPRLENWRSTVLGWGTRRSAADPTDPCGDKFQLADSLWPIARYAYSTLRYTGAQIKYSKWGRDNDCLPLYLYHLSQRLSPLSHCYNNHNSKKFQFSLMFSPAFPLPWGYLVE